MAKYQMPKTDETKPVEPVKATAPETPTQQEPKREEWKEKSRVPITQNQMLLRQLVDHASLDAPVIENIQDLFVEDRLRIPFDTRTKYADRSYKWLALDETAPLSTYGGMYVPVNRMNHADLPTSLFEDSTGAIVFEGQNFLAFCRRENVDAINKHVIKTFGERVRKLEDFDHAKYGQRGQVVVERLEERKLPGANAYGPEQQLENAPHDF